MDPTVQVAGIPVKLTIRGDGFVTEAAFQHVFINGSPLIFYFDPPVASVEEVSLPGLLLFLIGAITNGATFNF